MTGGRIDRAERLIKATPASVYAAFIDKEMILRWLPPKGARGILDAFEPRPGGAFHMTLLFETAPGKTTDNSDTVNGRFVELIPNERIFFRFVFASPDPAYAGTMMMGWALSPADSGTLVTVTAQDVPPGIAPVDHEAGMRSSLANLANLLE